MSDNEHDHDLQNPLNSELFYAHRRLQRAAMEDSTRYIKKGQEGRHIRALQKGLNHIRKNWRLLDVDGKFGDNTFAALKACQDELGRWDSSRIQEEARLHVSKVSKFKWMLRGIKSDGIAGPITLTSIDDILICGWNARDYLFGKCA